ncbi:hypothetical protein ABIE87_003551 [Bradyrhizobium diazoefficiens]|uniref:hypothetical protein n=1 Tax=Bradyrhizobium diazoefficiens TaxID=1355477 RepID=UPI003511FCA9
MAEDETAGRRLDIAVIEPVELRFSAMTASVTLANSQLLSKASEAISLTRSTRMPPTVTCRIAQFFRSSPNGTQRVPSKRISWRLVIGV